MNAPLPVMWGIRNDGTLIGVTYDKEQETLGWHFHYLGGYTDEGDTLPPVVESIAVIPAPSIDKDELWLSVRRTINGSVVRTVETLQKFWETGDVTADSYFVDCGATYSGAPTTTVSGLTWLANEVVTLLADGAAHPDVTVSAGGVVTLTRSASKVQVGLKYSSRGATLRLEAGGSDGTAQGKIKRIHRVTFRFFQSVGLKLLTNRGVEIPEPFRSSADLMDAPVGLFTGDKRWAAEDSYGTDGIIEWLQDDPLPSNILMLTAQLDTYDG
jgi:hypothetical protein